MHWDDASGGRIGVRSSSMSVSDVERVAVLAAILELGYLGISTCQQGTDKWSVLHGANDCREMRQAAIPRVILRTGQILELGTGSVRTHSKLPNVARYTAVVSVPGRDGWWTSDRRYRRLGQHPARAAV
jgi:hypothetical protein